jgi:hypothetical protein
MTPVADGAQVAAHFRRAHHLIIANSFHVNAKPEARSDCAMILVRRFLEKLTTDDERCAATVPPVRLVPRFARRVNELTPAEAFAGNQAAEPELRAVSAALLACEDVITRVMEYGVGEGLGLRGGTFVAAAVAGAAAYRIVLHDVRWTEDLAISGSIDWPGRSGPVRARLTLQGVPPARGTLQLEWPEGVAGARATVRGKLGGRRVLAAAPAP